MIDPLPHCLPAEILNRANLLPDDSSLYASSYSDGGRSLSGEANIHIFTLTERKNKHFQKKVAMLKMNMYRIDNGPELIQGVCIPLNPSDHCLSDLDEVTPMKDCCSNYFCCEKVLGALFL